MPLIGVIIGGINFTNLSIKIGESVIAYGSFIQNIIDFLIIAACIFAFVKFVNKLTNLNKVEVKEEPKKEEPKVAEDIKLLTEIRDLLKKQNTNSKKTK